MPLGPSAVGARCRTLVHSAALDWCATQRCGFAKLAFPSASNRGRAYATLIGRGSSRFESPNT